MLQQIYGLSPQGFSLVFGINSLGIMAMSWVGGRLATRWAPVAVLGLGLGLNLLGALGVAATTLSGAGLPPLIGSLFVMVSAVGMIFPTATTLALADYPHQAGSASSLLGLGQYVVGAVAAPLVGIAGEQTRRATGRGDPERQSGGHGGVPHAGGACLAAPRLREIDGTAESG